MSDNLQAGNSPTLEGVPVDTPSTTISNAELLAKYKSIGEDHETYKELKEALARNQSLAVATAVAKLEVALHPAKSTPVKENGSTPRFKLWNMLWILLLGGGLTCISFWYINSHIRTIIDKQPKDPKIGYVGSELLGGKPSNDFAVDIVNELISIKPDNVMFVGHQLAKKEVVNYLSAISKQARVKVLIGANEAGINAVEDIESPLRKIYFTELRAANCIIRSQILVAINTTSKKAVALIGTYPYDNQDASRGEHYTVCIRNYNDCVYLYNNLEKLFPTH